MADVRSVAVAYWVGTGSRDEPGELAGASHFLEHLLFKGTERRTAAAIAEELDEVGGDCNAFTTKEYTTFYVRLLSEHLLARTRHPERHHVGARAPLRRHRGRAHRHPRRDPDARRRAGRPGGGAVAVGALPRPPARARHPGDGVVGAGASPARTSAGSSSSTTVPRTWSSPSPATARHDAVAADLERRFAGTARGRGPRRARRRGPTWWRSTWSRRPTEQAHLVYGTRSVDRFDERRWALAVLNHVLGGGLSSRLFQKVREQRGLAYSVWSERAAYQDAGSLAVVVGTAPEHVDEVLRIVGDEFELLATDGRDRAGAGGGQGQPARRDAAVGRGLGRPHEPHRCVAAAARRGALGRRGAVPDRRRRRASRSSRSRPSWSQSPRTLSAVGPFDARRLRVPPARRGRPVACRPCTRSVWSAPAAAWAKRCAGPCPRRRTWSWWPRSTRRTSGEDACGRTIVGEVNALARPRCRGGRRLHHRRRRAPQRRALRAPGPPRRHRDERAVRRATSPTWRAQLRGERCQRHRRGQLRHRRGAAPAPLPHRRAAHGGRRGD